MNKDLKVAFFIGTFTGPSGRFRFLQFIPEFEKLGCRISVKAIKPMRLWNPPFKNWYLKRLAQIIGEFIRLLFVLYYALGLKKYDVVFLNKDLSPSTGIYFYEKIFHFFNKNLVFDIDDAIYLSKQGARDKKFKKILPLMKAIIAGNPLLKAYGEQHCKNVFYIPMAIKMSDYHEKKWNQQKFSIGWSGSDNSFTHTLPMLKDMFIKLSKKIDYKLIIMTNTDPQLEWEGVDYQFTPWSEANEVNGLLEFDVGVMPLEDNEFQRHKCALKAVQYMAVGIPALVSPVGVNEEIVKDGLYGYHCITDEDWLEKLSYLYHHPEKMKEMGKHAREKALESYDVSVLAKEYVSIFRDIKSGAIS